MILFEQPGRQTTKVKKMSYPPQHLAALKFQNLKLQDDLEIYEDTLEFFQAEMVQMARDHQKMEERFEFMARQIDQLKSMGMGPKVGKSLKSGNFSNSETAGKWPGKSIIRAGQPIPARKQDLDLSIFSSEEISKMAVNLTPKPIARAKTRSLDSGIVDLTDEDSIGTGSENGASFDQTFIIGNSTLINRSEIDEILDFNVSEMEKQGLDDSGDLEISPEKEKLRHKNVENWVKNQDQIYDDSKEVDYQKMSGKINLMLGVSGLVVAGALILRKSLV